MTAATSSGWRSKPPWNAASVSSPSWSTGPGCLVPISYRGAWPPWRAGRDLNSARTISAEISSGCCQHCNGPSPQRKNRPASMPRKRCGGACGSSSCGSDFARGPPCRTGTLSWRSAGNCRSWVRLPPTSMPWPGPPANRSPAAGRRSARAARAALIPGKLAWPNPELTGIPARRRAHRRSFRCCAKAYLAARMPRQAVSAQARRLPSAASAAAGAAVTITGSG